MAKKAKKSKKRVKPMPKLGWKDLCLYRFILTVCFLGAFLSVFFPLYYCNKIAKSDVNIIAYVPGTGTLHCLWLAILLIIIGLIVYVELYVQRIPVFGRADIRYGAPIYPNIYPLLSKNKPKYSKVRKIDWILSAVLAVCLIFAVAIYPRSFYGRYELHSDGTVTVLDSKNHNEVCYSISDFDAVCLDTGRTNTGRYGIGGKWYVTLEITFNDGKSRSFSVESFGEDWKTAIEVAETLKSHYGSLLSIDSTENLWKVVRDENMSAEEEMLLYALFEVN